MLLRFTRSSRSTPRPVFETKAELVLVDVNVVDRESKPVTTLTPADFQLEVNGQPRPISSIQFISTTPTNATPSTPRESASTSNETETTGRLLLFVVDEGSLRVGASRSLLRTAQTLFDRLAPGDMVGLARIPTGVGGVEFTADRKRITDALMRVTGAASSRTGMSRVNISEAWALENNDPGTFQQAIDRECQGETGAGLEACQNQVEADARQLVLEASARARSTLQSMEALLRNMVQLKTPVNIVMISEGMFVARDRSSMAELGRRAAEARATIHIIRPGQSFFDIEDRGLPSANSRFFDDGVDERGTRTGGRANARIDDHRDRQRQRRVRSAWPRAVRLLPDRLRAHRSGSHRQGTPHQGRGAAARPHRARAANVRHSRHADETTVNRALTPQQQVGEVLKSPLPVRGLPMRVATYTAVDTATAKVRVVITAEVGDPATTPAEWPIGVIILDKNDKIVVNRGGVSTLLPASAKG